MSSNNFFDINRVITNLVENSAKSIINKLGGIIKKEFIKVQVDFNISFKDYLRASYSKYSKIKTILYKTEPKDLYSFFVCNDLENDKLSVDISENIDELLKVSRYIFIEGSGGIGKSTLMKHIFINCLKTSDLIPIFIELRGLSNYSGTLLEYIYSTMVSLKFTLAEEYFIYAMSTGCFLFLFDGFDEVKESRIALLQTEIETISSQYDKNHVIITSRPGRDYSTYFQRFTLLNCMEFDKWQSVKMIGLLEYDVEIKNRFTELLNKSLYVSHKTFASNPLLLTILLLTYESYAEIPTRLHIFYSQAFDTLYSKHDATKSGYKREMLCRLPSDDFRSIIAEICFQTYIKQNYEISIDDLRSLLHGIMKKHVKLDFDPDNFIVDLCLSICLLVKDGINYRFTHRSFQEYFTATYIRDLSDKALARVCNYLIKDNRIQSLQDDMILMLYDMIPDRFEHNVMIPLLNEFESNWDKNNTIYEYYLIYMYPKFSFNVIEGESIKFRAKYTTDSTIRLIYESIKRNYNDEIINEYSENTFYEVMKKNGISLREPIINVLTGDTQKKMMFLEDIRKIKIGKTIDKAVALKQRLCQKEYINDSDISDLLSQ